MSNSPKLFGCKQVVRYLNLKGYESASNTIQGVQLHLKPGHDPIFTRCENDFMTESTVRLNILNKTNDDFESFVNIIKVIII